MAFRWSLLVAPLALAATIQLSQAAQIGWPLPDGSTEVNGVVQSKTSHVVVKVPHANPLPDTGLHPHAAAGLARRYSGTPIDVLRYHNDNYPTGWNQSETDLNPTTVHSGSFGLLKTLKVDGNVHAQPLMVSNFTMGDGAQHNVLIVVTGHDTVYAFDAQTYKRLWHRSLGTSQSTGDVGCGDINPEYGISSTPVIIRSDANTATIYLVAATEPAHLSFHTQIFAIDLKTGKNVMKPREIDPQAKLPGGAILHFNPQNQWNRASLAYSNGSIYVGVGSHCDNNAGNISGWMLRYDASTLKLLNAFNTIETPEDYELSSIWMSGYSPAISPDGSKIYAVTGNGAFNLTKKKTNYGESVIGLDNDLNKKTVDYFTPNNYADLNNGDTDFGSGGAMLLPTVSGQTAPPLLVAEGKASQIYLLDSTHLGGLQGDGTTAPQPLQQIGDSSCWCGPAYYVGPSGGVVFYQGWDVLKSYAVATGSTPSLTKTNSGTVGSGFGGSFPVVSSNGSTAHTGVVWVLHRDTNMQLEAYNAETLGAPIFAANSGKWSGDRGDFSSPLVANGRVYSPAYKTVAVFGLTD
ncbi:MAG TPA: hypothetical protein VMF58_00730 [Rhizomicrobium sp.]|nr:hypothetical protein [Rhizomicrobium sp.]